MPLSIRNLFHAAIADLERDVDTVEDLLALGEGHGERVRLLPYAGYRNADTLRVHGRVVRPGERLAPGAGTVERMRAIWALYDSAELTGVPVRVEAHGRHADLVSDEEGYWSAEIPLDGLPLPERTAWEAARVSAPGREAQAASVPVPILAPGTDGHWGVISDIDDTVVETGATDWLRNWRRVLVDRPSDRLVVPGAPDLFRAIASDPRAPVRPVFYVSSSPWNLYGFLLEYLELNGLPHGPMLLKDWGVDAAKLFMSGHDQYKLAAIETILAFYPGHRFLLIGDNGQRDVSIYARAVADYGTRIAAVFIRDVEGGCREGPEAELLRGIERAGVPTYCGAGFAEAVAVFEALGLDRPAEAARAASTAAG